MSFAVRLARAADAGAVAGVEISAGESFRALPDLAWIADDEVGGEDTYSARREAERGLPDRCAMRLQL